MISISLLNGMAVGIFGMVLAAAFCDIHWTMRRKLLMGSYIAGLLLLQGLVYFVLSPSMLRSFYPLITHVPLIIVLWTFSKSWTWSVISVLTAYLCCYPRRWISLFLVALFSGDTITRSILQNLVELLITFPLLWFLIYFVAPSVRTISRDSLFVQYQFGLIPLLSYAFDYLTQVYTRLFVKGTPVVAEFMSFVCCGAYLVFVVSTSREKEMRMQLEQREANLNMQVEQAVREMQYMREAQKQMRIYRHDLRHHMQYVLACIENDKLEQARDYIHELDSGIEGSKVVSYCENEGANLILSSFAERARDNDIVMQVRAEIPHIIPVAESDLCVLLSNALENALHACQKCKAKGLPGVIDVSAYEQNGKIFLQIANSCDEAIVFDNGIPVTDRPGHGIGVRSICALVERYRGIYDFAVKEGRFILRVTLF